MNTIAVNVDITLQDTQPTQEVVTLTITNEFDPWGLLLPAAVGLCLLVIAEFVIAALAALLLKKWRHGVFVAAIVAPLAIVAFFFPMPIWILPLAIIGALNGTHFAIVLFVYSVVFGLKRLIQR